MYQTQPQKIHLDEISRCEERNSGVEDRKDLTPSQKSDSELRENIYHAFWKEDVLRALEYFEIDVLVKNGIVHLNGHIMSSSSQGRIESAMQSVSGILGIKNNLVLDDKLTTDVATSLGALEHSHDCKFFTGSSHGVISLNGKVKSEKVKLLAGQCAAQNPNVRGVINNIQVAGVKSQPQTQPFMQPTIGVVIYFLDGISGIVKHVIVNPNNRRVVAMVLQGRFVDQFLPDPTNSSEPPSAERRITVPMRAVRFLTKSSGFLHIRSYESNRFMDFDPDAFVSPDPTWTPPYPYCPDDVLFPIKYLLDTAVQLTTESQELPFGAVVEEASIRDQFFANDSFGL